MANRPERNADGLRVPPQSTEAEQSVIGGCMLSNEAYSRIAGTISEEDFYRRDHRLIFRAITKLAEANKPFDAVTLGEQLEKRGQADEAGGPSYLIELASSTPSAANIVAYAEIVKDKATLRRMIEAGTCIVNAAFQPDGRTTPEIYSEAQQHLSAAGPKALHKPPTTRETLSKVVKFMQLRMEEEDGELLGYATGCEDLDRLLNGLEPETITVLAARPSMGKTALGLQWAVHQALVKKNHALVLSIEMSATSLMMRAIACEGGIPLSSLRNPKTAQDHELGLVKESARRILDSGLLIDDGSLNVDQACARIRQQKMEHPDLSVVVIDYLQHMDLPKADTQSLAVQIVTRRLKALAKELKIAVVILSQLNRGLETRADRRPTMADLRESGAIEQDADNIVFIYRDAYYHKDPTKPSKWGDIVEIIVAKARNEQIGTAYMLSNLAMMRFEFCPAERVEEIINAARNNDTESRRPAVGARKAGRYHDNRAGAEA